MKKIIDESYDMQEELDTAYRSMDPKKFERMYGQPPGIVDYSQLPKGKAERYNALRDVRFDIKNMTDEEFDYRYHDTKANMSRRLDAWLLLNIPAWNADILIQAFKLNGSNDASDAEVERLLKNAQAVGELGEIFPQRNGIHWLRQQGIVPFGEFIGQHPYQDEEPIAPIDASPSPEPMIKGVTTAQIVEAFQHLVKINLGKAMTDKAVWTHDARVTSGTKGGKHKSLWDPVILATALTERYEVPLTKLNHAFSNCKSLSDWCEKWVEYSTM